MKVTLIAHTVMAATEDSDDQFVDTGYEPHPFHFEYERTLEPHLPANVSPADELAEFAGRACYQSWDRPNPKTATNEGYLANIISQGHFSVLEHASATFYITGVSRTLTHELVRHRHLSYSELSQRYVDVSDLSFVVPPRMAELGYRGEAAVDSAGSDYQGYVEDLQADGLSRKDARGAARNYLLAGWETRLVCSGNHRAFREMLWKRLSPAAEPEIRQLARELLRQLSGLAPSTYADLVKEYAQ